METFYYSVVTGMRFIEHGKAIYPQIQVGKILPMAKIDQKSIYWLKVPDYGDFYPFSFNNREFSFGDPLQMQFKNEVVTDK